MFPYYHNAKVWMPETENSTLLQLTAVLVPEAQTEIPSQSSYLDRLMDRVDWMIQRWMQEQEIAQAETCLMIQSLVNQSQLAIALPSLEESTLGWAQALTVTNFPLQETMEYLHRVERQQEPLMRFPSPLRTEAETIALAMTTIEQTHLEAWLELMLNLCVNPPLIPS
jgi:hypothetical protein